MRISPFAAIAFALSLSAQTLSAQTTIPLATPPAPIDPKTVVAEVDGKKYTAAEVDRLMALFPQMQMSVRKDPKMALGYLLLMRQMSELAAQAKLDQESPLKEQLEYNRIAAMSQAKINQVRNFENPIDADTEEKFYKEHPDRFLEAKVRVIYIAFAASDPNTLTEPQAKAKIAALAAKINSGADFGQLARENSDDKESAAKDGDFGVVRRNSSYPDSIKNAVFALQPGQISEPIRQANGFYLIRLDSLKSQPLKDVRSQINEELKQKGFNDWMQGLQKRFEVKVENPAYFAPKSGSPAPTQPR